MTAEATGPRANPPTDLTRLVRDAAGDQQSADQLLTLVYDQLRRMAQQRMNEERAGHTLQATALVHEAYLRLFGDTEVQWHDRRHFFGAAAEAMRRILIDRARRNGRARHGGGLQRIDLDAADLAAATDENRLLALDEALARLAETHPAKAELVKLRHFGGLSIEEAADVLGMSRATAYRHWEFARAWLLRDLEGARPGEK
jgi:RNA polymerase sigma factor (TIGR02999 family)